MFDICVIKHFLFVRIRTANFQLMNNYVQYFFIGSHRDLLYHCISNTTVFQIPLYFKYHCISNTTVFQIPLYFKYHCISNTTVFQIPLYFKYHCISNTTVFQIPLYFKYHCISNTTVFSGILQLGKHWLWLLGPCSSLVFIFSYASTFSSVKSSQDF